MEWHQTGQVCAVIANVNRTKKGKAYKATDFIPTVKRPAEQLQVSAGVLAFFGASPSLLFKPEEAQPQENHYGYYRRPE